MTNDATLLERLLDANRSYTDGGHDTEAPVAPRLKLAIVTCMDARVLPLKALGLSAGDTHVMRNAGARVTEDVLRSLAVSCGALGVRHVLVMPHSGCGMQKTEEELRAAIREASGDDGPAELLRYGDPEETLRQDVERVRTAPFLPAGLTVWGARLDVDTGQVTLEVPADPAS